MNNLCHAVEGRASAKGLSPLRAMTQDQTFLVPVRQEFFTRLYPEAVIRNGRVVVDRERSHTSEGDGEKAYLSGSKIRRINIGATLLLYVSRGLGAVAAVGTVTDSIVSDDANVVKAHTGHRTIFSMPEISEYTAKGPVLSILFTHDRFISNPITQHELQSSGALKDNLFSIRSVRPEGFTWLVQRLGE